MSKTLVIIGHPATNYGYSKSMSAAHRFNMNIKEQGEEVELLNLYETEWADIDQDVYAAFGHLMSGGDFNELSDAQKEKMGTRQAIMDQFVSADKYVFVYPMWELSFPAVIKKYLDTVVAAPTTFGYDENGIPYGKLENKKAIVITSGGSNWQDGSEYQEMMKQRSPYWSNFGRDLMFANLEFIGIKDHEYVIVDETNTPNQPHDTDASVERNNKVLDEIAKTW